MNIVIESEDYIAISRKYVSAMVILLAVEQLITAGGHITEVVNGDKVTVETSINPLPAENDQNGGEIDNQKTDNQSDKTHIPASSEAGAPSLTLTVPVATNPTLSEKVAEVVKEIVSSFNKDFFLDDTLSVC